jgi:hypothetical protein
MLDVTFGGNETVTGGRFHGAVLRLDTFQSTPAGGWAGSIFVYGAFMLKPVGTNITDPLLLRPAAACSGSVAADCVPVPAGNVAMVFTPRFNRDYYRIGAGVELLKLIAEINCASKPMGDACKKTSR